MSQNLYNFDFVDHFDLQVCNWNLVTQNLDFLIFFIIFFYYNFDLIFHNFDLQYHNWPNILFFLPSFSQFWLSFL